MSGKLQQAVRQATEREWGRCLLPYYQCTKTRRPVSEGSRRSIRTRDYPPVENPTCTAFGEYEEVLETVPLELTKDDVTWVASNIFGAVGALGAEVVELRNLLLSFGCA